MIAHKKEFYGGVGLLGLFTAVFVFMFQPVFDGKNSLEYLDNLYNSISKGSAYYIPDLKEQVKTGADKDVQLTLNYKSEIQATQSVELFRKAGATVEGEGKTLNVSGNLSAILGEALEDADTMYHNKGGELSAKYGMEERRVLYNWWASLKALDSSLKDQSLFAEAKIASTVDKKAVESSYNYYTIEPLKITDKLGVVIFSLAFYVIYTLWYGFAILFIFEGWGMKLEH